MAPNLLMCNLEMGLKKKLKICLLGLGVTRENLCDADMEFWWVF